MHGLTRPSNPKLILDNRVKRAGHQTPHRRCMMEIGRETSQTKAVSAAARGEEGSEWGEHREHELEVSSWRSHQ